MTDPTASTDPTKAPIRQWAPYQASLRLWLSIPGNSERSIDLLLTSLEGVFQRRAVFATQQCEEDSAIRVQGTGWSFRLPEPQSRTLGNAELWAGEMILGLLQELAQREMQLINFAVRSRSVEG